VVGRAGGRPKAVRRMSQLGKRAPWADLQVDNAMPSAASSVSAFIDDSVARWRMLSSVIRG
jgi:hypothetical protein